jgi:hypothetical protein
MFAVPRYVCGADMNVRKVCKPSQRMKKTLISDREEERDTDELEWP